MAAKGKGEKPIQVGLDVPEHSVAYLSRTIAKLKEEKSAWIKNKHELESEIVRLQEECQASNKKDEHTLVEHQSSQTNHVAKLSTMIRNLKSETQKLAKENKDLKTEIVKFHEESASHRQVDPDLTVDAVEEPQDFLQQLQEHETARKEAEDNFQDMQSFVGDLRQQIEDLEHELGQSREENIHLLSLTEMLQGEKTTMQANLNEAVSNILLFKENCSMNSEQQERIEMVQACLSSLHEQVGPPLVEQPPEGALQHDGIAADDDNIDMKCVICYERERSVEIRPCMHVVMCDRCAEFQMNENGTCPVDREPIESMTNIMES
ncbi:uncharacterized protein LOC144444894 [Glandiceps talaboti]